MPLFERRRFETTSWSLIRAASADGTAGASDALADLCTRYWSPVYGFVRSQGYDPDDAEDLTQSFFATLLEKNYVADADPARGRFRTFLLASVKHFLSNERDRKRTQKRGGGRQHLAIDVELGVDPSGPLTPEQVFDKRWALSVLEQSLATLREEARAEGKLEQLELLLPFVAGDAERRAYADLAASTGMTEGALRVAVHRQRLRFREHLRRTIEATVVDTQQIDDEIHFLISAVGVIPGDREHAR